MEDTSQCELDPGRLNPVPTMMTTIVQRECNLKEMRVVEKDYQPSFDCPTLYSTVWPGRRKTTHFVSQIPFLSDSQQVRMRVLARE
jgi:hypothetical protein